MNVNRMAAMSVLLCGVFWTTLPLYAADEKAKAAEVAPISPGETPIKLFDGKSLDGFYTYLKDTKYEDPRQVFRVTDGMLHVTGDGLGCLTTNKEYREKVYRR